MTRVKDGPQKLRNSERRTQNKLHGNQLQDPVMQRQGPFEKYTDQWPETTDLEVKDDERGFRETILTNRAYLKAINILIDV